MKFIVHKFKYVLLLSVLACLWACDRVEEDVRPQSFNEFELYPDVMYDYNAPGQTSLLRLDPLHNDSIRIPVTVSFTESENGRFVVEPDGSTSYTPDVGYIGKDSLTYTVCSTNTCKTEKILIILEELPDPATCTLVVANDQTVTSKNRWVDIRIYMNDVICEPYNMSTYHSFPEKGIWEDVSYSGSSPKNRVFRYYPPKDYVGQDRFIYRVFTSDTEYLEGTVTITIKP